MAILDHQVCIFLHNEEGQFYKNLNFSYDKGLMGPPGLPGPPGKYIFFMEFLSQLESIRFSGYPGSKGDKGDRGDGVSILMTFFTSEFMYFSNIKSLTLRYSLNPISVSIVP